eukprot:Em0007g704a
MLSDFAGFLVSLVAIWLAARPATKRLSFGWHRAEVIGAIISVLLIWVLTGVLVYEAILRVINRNYEINADVMLIISCAGVFLNVLMCSVLHDENDEEKEQSRARKRYDVQKSQLAPQHRSSISKCPDDEKKLSDLDNGEKQLQRGGAGSAENINLRAAMLHVLGDMVQSPEWKLADPACTFLFSVLVLFSTINILRDAILVLMEGTPMDVDFDEIKNGLLAVRGVKSVHNLGIWSLTLNKTAVAAHLVLDTGASPQLVLREATTLLRGSHNVSHTILQTEEHESFMESCSTCRNITPLRRTCWAR